MSPAVPLSRTRLGAAHLLGIFCAAILVIAAFFKAGDPELFAAQIAAHDVTPASWSSWLALLFIAAELILGAALIAFVWPRITFGLTILMMLGFIGVTAWAWAHGNISDCGCFGRAIERGPREVIIEDSVIIAASVLGIWLSRGFETTIWRQRFFALLMIPTLGLIFLGTTLPIDSLVVGVGPGSDMHRLVAEDVPVVIEEGEVLVAMVGDDCPACEQGLPDLKQIAQEHTVAQVVGLYAGKPAAALAWRLQHHPNFPLGNSPARVARQYYRRLPAVFLLQDGIVRHVWWGRMPSVDDVRKVKEADAGTE